MRPRRIMRRLVLLSLLWFASLPAAPQAHPEATMRGPFSETELIKGLAGAMSAKRFVTLVGEWGVDFSLTPEIEERLRAVGADDELVEAVRKGKAKPLSETDLLKRLAGGMESKRLATQVGQSGVEFSLTREIEKRLRAAGADDELVEAIKAKATPKGPVEASAAPPSAGAETRAGAPSGRGGSGPYFGSIPDFGQAENGVKLADVRPGSPAAKAGLLAGDVLIQFGKTPVKNLDDFTNALRKSKVGDVVDVRVLRGGQTVTVEVTLEQRR